MQPKDQPEEIEYLGTIQAKDAEMIGGPKETFPDDLKGRVNARGGFKDLEVPEERFELGPRPSKAPPPRVNVDYQLPKKSRNRKKPESLKGIRDALFAQIWPKTAPEASNRPQDRSNVRQQAPDQKSHMAPTQFPAELGTYMNNSSTVGPIRVPPPQRQIGRSQELSARPNMKAAAVRQKVRIVAPGSSARNTKKSPAAGFQKNAQGFITGSSMNMAPTPPFHGQITLDQQRQMVPTQSMVDHSSQWLQNSTAPIMNSAPTPTVHSQVTVDKQSQLSNKSQHQLNQFDGFYNQVQKQLNSSQVTVEQQGSKRVFHLPYNGPVKVERLAYDELFDPNFKPEQTIIHYKSEPAAEIQVAVKQPKNKKTESKKEEKKVVEEPKEIEEELEEGPIAALEYEDPVEQLEFENYVKSVAEEHGDEFLGMLLFDLIPGLTLDFNGHIARK